MSQIEFGLYYIPDGDSTFYKMGSKIVGYDIRNEEIMDSQEVGGVNFENIWKTDSRQYGLHATITDVVTADSRVLSTVVRQVSGIIKDTDYRNTEIHIQKVESPKDNQSIIVASVKRTNEIKNLHRRLLKIQNCGDSTIYTRRIKSHPKWVDALTSEQQKNLRRYMSPYVLSEFLPHFTLLNPFAGDDDQITKDINNLLSLPTSLKLQSISLVGRNYGDEFLKIYDEIPVNK
ncbi:MAG: hypothetical protein AAB535_01540 [Patescibacteria group bacterium]